jgi:uncharacterized protein YabE (DUF348 family)
MINKTPRKIVFLFLISALIFGTYKLFLFSKSKRIFSENVEYQKNITLNDNSLVLKTSTSANFVSDFLKEKNINLLEHDQVIPDQDSKIFSGSQIIINRAVKIKIEVDGKEIENYTLAKNISDVLLENNVLLTRLDKTYPNLSSPPRNDEEIIVTRINIEEKIEKEDIDFKTISKTDSKLGWREKKITQKGEKGIREVKYEITYKNGKEISRKILEKNITKDPVPQIEVQGTYVKLGKKHTGVSSWYAFKSGMFAANPWLPMGSYVKVTSTASGKSVIVQINDRGPFGNGRIIDLDKVAFQKLAPLGAGVINVKMEEILN